MSIDLKKIAIKKVLHKIFAAFRHEVIDHSEILWRKLQDDEIKTLYEDLKAEYDKRFPVITSEENK